MTTTTTRTRWAAAAAALLLAPALLTACSSGGDDSTPTPKADTAAEFAACMRDAGYDFPDSAGDEANLSVPDGVDPEQYSDDMAKCAGTGAGAGDTGGAKGIDKSDPAWKKTVACIRGQGFEDFPDDPDRTASYKPADQTAFDQAFDDCSVGGGTSAP